MERKYRAMSAEEKAVITEEFRKCGRTDAYYLKSTSNYFESDDGLIVTLKKPTIITDFHFGEHDYENRSVEAHAASKSEEYFIDANMNDNVYGSCYVWTRRHEKNYGRAIWIKRGAFCSQPGDCRLGQLSQTYSPWDYQSDEWHEMNGFRRLNDGELKRLFDAERRQAALFEKRLRSYLKRYGLSKVTAQTYWADR